MATQPSQPVSPFAMGEDPQSLQANQAYKEAMDKLLQTYEARSEKPFFDPKMLSMAQAFAKPTQTGSFFESLGNVAGSLQKSQEDEQTKAEELARMRLELAGMGIQQSNQQAAMKEYRTSSQPAPQPGQQAGQQEKPAESPSSGVLSSMGIEDQGVQMFPPQPLIPERQFIAGKVATGMNPIDARMAYQDYLAKDIQLAQNGMVIQRSTGKGFDMPDPTPVSVPFLSLNGEPFQITKTQARRLDQYAREGNNEARIAYENQLRGIRTPKPAEAPPAQPPAQPPLQVTPQTGAVPPPAVKQVASPSPIERPSVPSPVAPSAPPPPPPPPPAMTGMKTPAQLAKEKAEEESRRAISQARETEQAKADIAETAKAKEENRKDERETIVELKTKARAQANIADQVAKIATDYPNSMGTTAKPGPLAAGIKLLESGASIGGESAKASALENAYQTLTGTQDEISARRVLMGLAAEYLFNLRALTKGQGTITDYETKVLESIGPSLGDDAKTARFKAHIMKMHAEGEIDRVNAYQDWKNSPENKNLGWRDFLGSKENDKFARDYNAKLDKAYDAFLGRKNPIGPPPETKPVARPTASSAPVSTSNDALKFAIQKAAERAKQ